MVRNNLNVPRSLFVGFDTLFEDLERIHQSARSGNDNYPPHNVVKIDDEKFLIELAVAGFKKSDIILELKDGILKIKGDVESNEFYFTEHIHIVLIKVKTILLLQNYLLT